MATTHESWWFKRTGLVNVTLVVGILAVMALEPFHMPGWAVVGFVVVVLVMALSLTSERIRIESRLARSIWQALTGK